MRFRKKAQCALLIMCLWFSTVLSAQEAPAGLEKQTVHAVVRQVCELLRKNYVYPDKAEMIIAFLRKQDSTGSYDTLPGLAQLADRITQDIRKVHEDRHLRIQYDPKLEKDILAFHLQGSKLSLKEDQAKEKAQNFYFRKLEILPGNTGYIDFTNFALPGDESRRTIHAAMQFVANTDALIIDLRNNRGGNAETANQLLGYFFPVRTKTGRSFSRIENGWKDNYVGNTPEANKGLVLKMPVYLLVGPATFSAAEGFAYVLQNQLGATLVGMKTSGGAHLTRSFAAGNGFVAFIPYMRSENQKTKTDWEGKGVLPGIEAPVESSLWIAQNEILKRKLVGAEEKDRKRINWLINYNRSQFQSVAVDTATLDKYTGRFAEFEITKQDGRLFFRDVNQRNKTPFPMIALTDRLFQVARDYQVEFVDESGKQFQAVNISWSDGWTEKIERGGK